MGSNSTNLEVTKKPPFRGGLFCYWRRGWDSNPRYGRTVHLISNQAHSTTLAPLREVGAGILVSKLSNVKGPFRAA